MSDIPAHQKNLDSEIVPVFSGPVRRAVAWVLVIGPLLQAIEFVFGKEIDDNAAQVAFWAAHPAQIGISSASGLLAVPFLLAANAILVALSRSYSPRLAWAGGIFMTFGMVGLGAVHGYELAAYGLTLAGEPSAAATTLNGSTLGLPGVVLFVMFLAGAVLGTIILALAAWRSPFVPRAVVLCMIAFAVLDFAVEWGVISHLVNLVGFIILARATMTGYGRQPLIAKAPEIQPG